VLGLLRVKNCQKIEKLKTEQNLSW
jgi:hypothetical protein